MTDTYGVTHLHDDALVAASYSGAARRTGGWRYAMKTEAKKIVTRPLTPAEIAKVAGGFPHYTFAE